MPLLTELGNLFRFVSTEMSRLRRWDLFLQEIHLELRPYPNVIVSDLCPVWERVFFTLWRKKTMHTTS
jgi:hypothetical protein